LPGFFFLALVLLNLPGLTKYLYLHVFTGGVNFIDSLGHVAGCAAICYFLGWLFSSLTWRSKREAVREKYEKKGGLKKMNEMYQRIRIAHPAAGFRIVKLRAEARMLETTRTAMIAIIILTIVYLCILLILGIMLILGYRSLYPIRNVMWVRSFIGLFIAGITLYCFYKREEKAWKNYYGNVNIIYEILHDYVDPVRPFPDNT
jgi:hypothetical protein